MSRNLPWVTPSRLCAASRGLFERRVTKKRRVVRGIGWVLCFPLCFGFAQWLRAADCEAGRGWDSGLTQVAAGVAASDWLSLEAAGRALVGVCPEAGKAHYWLGVALYNQNRFFAASRSLRRSAALGYEAAHLALAQAYAELNQGHFFREEIEAAKKLAPASSAALFVEAKYFYEKERRLDLAEASLRRVIEIEPLHYKAFTYLGLCLRWAGRLEEAVTALSEAVAISGRKGILDPLPNQALAEIYLETEQFEEALSFAEKAVEADRASSTSQYLFGKCLWKVKHLDEAIGALEKASALDKSDPAPKYLLGQIHLARGDQARAAQELAAFQELEKLYGRASK